MMTTLSTRRKYEFALGKNIISGMSGFPLIKISLITAPNTTKHMRNNTMTENKQNYQEQMSFKYWYAEINNTK